MMEPEIAHKENDTRRLGSSRRCIGQKPPLQWKRARKGADRAGTGTPGERVGAVGIGAVVVTAASKIAPDPERRLTLHHNLSYLRHDHVTAAKLRVSRSHGFHIWAEICGIG